MARVLLLKCAVQSYAWGKPGRLSEVANLSQSGNPSFDLKEHEPYAELWMGTHPKGPSHLASTGETLADWLANNDDCKGTVVAKQFPRVGQLPFLLKVLSVNKALSIQAHPNKMLAEELHSLKPDKYPDANHKPEMAIALTPFEGLCGFRPKEEIVGFLNNIPEFRTVIGDTLADGLMQATSPETERVALQKCFTSLMTCEEERVKSSLGSLIQRIKDCGAAVSKSCLGELLLRLDSQFPGDVGCFCVYFLNHMILQPGEAMFLEANLPHAYLSGDCMECMACSDNVVRAGLTPKFKDVSTLCSMLNYTCKPAAANLFESKPQPSDPCVAVYDPPVPDFTLARIQVPSGTEEYTLSALDSASVVLVVQGQGQGNNQTIPSEKLHINKGSVIFVSASESLTISIASEGMLMFRAYCQL